MAYEVISGMDEEAMVEVPLSTDAAFAEFFSEAKAPMHRLAYLLTGSNMQAEEAVQESFVQVFERWARIDDPGAYLRRAVVNRCTSWHRHRAVVLRTRTRVATNESYLDQPDELTDALAQLPARRRAMLVLRYYERLELEEIADTLGVSVGTVKSTVHRALAQLKGILE